MPAFWTGDKAVMGKRRQLPSETGGGERDQETSELFWQPRSGSGPPIPHSLRLNTSRLTPNARWLLQGSYGTNLDIRRPEPVGDDAQPIFTSIISTARYLCGLFLHRLCPSSAWKATSPTISQKVPVTAWRNALGARCNTYLRLLGWPCGILLGFLTHIIPRPLYRDQMGKGLRVCMQGWEEIKLEPAQRSLKAPCCVPRSWAL